MRTIGVIVPRLGGHFMTSVLRGIEAAAAHYEVIITHSQENVDKEINNARLLYDRQVDGVIVSLCAGTGDLSHFDLFMDAGIPVVFFDRVDNSRCGMLATEHLTRQGCKRIAIIQEDDGVEAAARIMDMDPRPDGLFITSDLVAATCMHALTEAGLRVPGDIAIVGFNNDPLGRLVSPSLTTIDYPGLEIGRQAAMSLLDRLCGCKPFGAPGSTVVAAELIIRNSSLKRTCE